MKRYPLVDNLLPTILNNSFRLKLIEREYKDSECNNLIARISRSGVEMAPCSFCVRHKCYCIINSKESNRCIECMRYRCPHCNFINKLPLSRDWETIDQ